MKRGGASIKSLTNWNMQTGNSSFLLSNILNTENFGWHP